MSPRVQGRAARGEAYERSEGKRGGLHHRREWPVATNVPSAGDLRDECANAFREIPSGAARDRGGGAVGGRGPPGRRRPRFAPSCATKVLPSAGAVDAGIDLGPVHLDTGTAGKAAVLSLDGNAVEAG